MQNSGPNINVDLLVQQLVTLYPQLTANDQQLVLDLRNKLHEQLIAQVPHVELEHLDLKCIIMNVKKSLSEFQRRIDESVVQQQLRRTARVRKAVNQDPSVMSIFKNDRKLLPTDSIKSEPTCNNNKCSHQVSELNDLIQVESLPVSASTNLLTIFVPSILQEKMNSCKYKISIDLNRLDLTKKILDLNVEHHVNTNFETKTKDESPNTSIEIEMDKICHDKAISGTTINAKCTRNSVETQTSDTESETKPLIVANSENVVSKIENPPSLETSVSIQTEDIGKPLEIQRTGKKRGPKRKEPKPPSNDPPKKRGRKPGSKNKNKKEKSDLAKYVEMFACNAGSPSAVSQIVTSTTQNWDINPDETGQIAYFMNGQWTVNNQSSLGRQLVPTTNGTVCLEESTAGAQETFIPFEDFVNFIENPSLDGEQNVIARVLDGAVDPAPNQPNLQDSTTIDMNEQTPTPLVMETQSADPINHIPTTSNIVEDRTTVSYDQDILNPAHSTVVNDQKVLTVSSVLDLSKDCTLPLTLDILDLTQRRISQPISPLQSEPPCITDNYEKEKSVVFSTTRNMPLLDLDTEIFSSTPQEDENQNRVVFSVAPQTAQTSPSSMRNSFHSTEGDSNVDSAIEVERRDTMSLSSESPSEAPRCLEIAPTTLKERTMPEAMKGMSLLEIENDIDDSLLDFDNGMDDDLLSLAPSSGFNSPNPEQSAEADNMDIEEPVVVAQFDGTRKPTSPRVKIQVELNLSQSSEDDRNASSIKSFKIPRKLITCHESTVDTQVKLTNNISKEAGRESNTIAIAPTTATAPQRCAIKSHSSAQLSTTNSTDSETASYSRDIVKMFGSLCYGFLADKCFSTSCRFSHQLLDPSVVKNSLSHLRIEVLHSAYRFIWRNHKLFQLYFVVFCDEYARRNIRNKLSNMISDCEMQPLCLPFLRNIYSSLISTGLNKVNACRFILNRAKARTSIAIDILLELILESGATMFSTVIAQFAETANYKFRMKDINELAAICLRSGNAELVTVLIKCLISVDQTEFVTMRSTELIQILEMVKNGNFGRL